VGVDLRQPRPIKGMGDSKIEINYDLPSVPKSARKAQTFDFELIFNGNESRSVLIAVARIS
jgi:hypothetical protein